MHDSVPFDASHADTEEVCQWLQAGLDGYLKADVGRWAFYPLERYIGVREDLADDIQAIYDTLIPDAQGRWRSAIRNLLAMHGQDPSKKEATGVLVDLAELIHAYEVLEVLPNLLPCDESLFHQVLRTAIALARQVDAARSCLEYIRTTPSFPAAYAGHILIALCRVAPDDWVTHVRASARQMEVLASQLTEDSTALRYYASAVLETISVSRAIVGLADLVDSSQCQWLWYEWLCGTDPLLAGDSNYMELVVLRYTNPVVSVNLDPEYIPSFLGTKRAWTDRQIKLPKSTPVRKTYSSNLLYRLASQVRENAQLSSIYFSELSERFPSLTELRCRSESLVAISDLLSFQKEPAVKNADQQAA